MIHTTGLDRRWAAIMLPFTIKTGELIMNTRPPISSQDSDTIKRLIDAHGLAAVLYTIKHICREKAEYISEQDPDDSDIPTWERCADLIDLAQEDAETLP